MSPGDEADRGTPLEEAPVGDRFAEILRLPSHHHSLSDCVHELLDLVVALLPGAICASMTRRSRDGWLTVAATDPAAEDADEAQLEHGHGPAVEVLGGAASAFADDLHPASGAWPGAGAAGLPERLRSAYSFAVEAARTPRTAVTVYADQPTDHTSDAELRAVAAATAEAVTTAVHVMDLRERADQLADAVRTNRRIGAAVGFVMHAYRLTETEAFALLRQISQHGNRRLRDLAEDVLTERALPQLPGPSERHG
ncbi:ANTAR domain-containing protein [Nakamurella endophytica]|uniref:ANTAR domain-containing protein n=1 Tax=Nakamurella endophytica TaxID=1748367 RepID=A0A917T6K7_9ACTN|nr:ANTAR domain-containing protein [Nakamurella endophytica]GGM12338.1 hypothetical protein GCM10011594_35250 [Nakamurella endophytica]